MGGLVTIRIRNHIWSLKAKYNLAFDSCDLLNSDMTYFFPKKLSHRNMMWSNNVVFPNDIHLTITLVFIEREFFFSWNKKTFFSIKFFQGKMSYLSHDLISNIIFCGSNTSTEKSNLKTLEKSISCLSYNLEETIRQSNKRYWYIKQYISKSKCVLLFSPIFFSMEIKLFEGIITEISTILFY